MTAYRGYGSDLLRGLYVANEGSSEAPGAEQGKFLEAIQEFYAEDATMQENNQPPRVGLAALLENERRVLASLKEIRVNQADSFLVDGDRSAINWVYLFVDARGREIRRNEMAYQVWQNGKIIRERFFYAADTALR